MNALEYKQIFRENQLVRSELVRTLEGCVRTLNDYTETLTNDGKNEEALFYKEQAEETKWLAIDTAMDEKEQGWEYLEKYSQNKQIQESENNRLRA